MNIIDKIDFILRENITVLESMDNYILALSKRHKNVNLCLKNDIKSILSAIIVREALNKHSIKINDILFVPDINNDIVSEQSGDFNLVLLSKGTHVLIKMAGELDFIENSGIVHEDRKKDSTDDLSTYEIQFNEYIQKSDSDLISEFDDEWIHLYDLIPEEIDRAIFDNKDSGNIIKNKKLMLLAINRILSLYGDINDSILSKQFILESKLSINEMYDTLLRLIKRNSYDLIDF